jgi:hypothetical protein
VIDIWKKEWDRCRFSLFNFILIWSVPAIVGELIGRAFEIKFLGMVAGFIYSLIKTQYDYLKTKI